MDIFASGIGDPLPVPYGQKGKPPTGYTGATGERVTRPDVGGWIHEYGGHNVAIRLAKDVVGIDRDLYKAEAASTLATFEAEHGALAPTWCMTSRTDGSGIALYRLPEGADETDLGDMGPGVEILRAGHRYAMALGSRHPEGRDYRVIDPQGDVTDVLPHVDELPVLTTEQVAGLTKASTNAPATPAEPTDASTITGAPQSAQDHLRGAYLPGALAGHRADVAEAVAMPDDARNADGKTWEGGDKSPGLVAELLCRAAEFDITCEALGMEAGNVEHVVDAFTTAGYGSEVRSKVTRNRAKARERGPALPPDWDAKVKAAQFRERSQALAMPPAAAPLEGRAKGDDDAPLDAFHRWSDVAVAEDFARTYAGQLVHSAVLGWMQYTGGRWKAVEEKTALTFASRHAKALARRAVGQGSDEMKAAAKRLEARALSAVVKISQGLPGITVDVDELDADPYLLNCADVTLDLRTTEARPHDPADLITKITAAAYRPDADRSVWDDFLRTVLPDEQERAYLQRVVGQALEGQVVEHLFPVLTGDGGNGKGTFYGAVRSAVGDYGAAIDPALLMSADKGKPGGPEMMRLLGARLVFASETGKGHPLDEALMKRLTGGDPLEARHHYKKPVEWMPTHQLIYVTNDLPRIKGNDEGVWRRMRVVPFDVEITDEQKDSRLGQTLQLHHEAVLSWAVEGYVEWRRIGMQEPPTVLRATAEYRQQSDAVSRFVAEDCLISPAAAATTREIFTAWERWARAEGADHLPEKGLRKELKRLGYEDKRTKTGTKWKGLSPYVTVTE